MVGPSVDALGGPAIGGPRPGFFGTQSYQPALGGYLTDLPWPLNSVTPTPNPNWFDIGDGNRVSRDEVERIYAEQQRRLKGQDKPEPQPASRLHVVNKWADGYVPRADQVANDERELDPTCSPYGGWERDLGYATNSAPSKRYQAQISHAPGLEYVVRIPGQKSVRFDGCAVWDPRHPLLEAKGPNYAPLIERARNSTFYPLMREKDITQPRRQADAAGTQRIEWHVAEPAAFNYFNELTENHQPPIVVQMTPPR
jgi:hypothetical protein